MSRTTAYSSILERVKDSANYFGPFTFPRAICVRATNLASRLATQLHERCLRWAPINRRTKGLLARNARLHGRHAGTAAHVIGNGSSAAHLDFTRFEGSITFATNSFYLHPNLAGFQPTYYLLVDPVFFEEGSAHAKLPSEISRRMLCSEFFVPTSAFESGAIPEDRLHYVMQLGHLSEGLNRVDLSRPIPGVKNSVQLAILAAMVMGCPTITLHGVDHDWLSHQGPDRYSHAGPKFDGKAPANPWMEKGYLGALVEAVEVWKGYITLARLAGSLGVQIVNASPGSFLDVFPRTADIDLSERSAA